jgi:ribosomal protein S27E
VPSVIQHSKGNPELPKRSLWVDPTALAVVLIVVVLAYFYYRDRKDKEEALRMQIEEQQRKEMQRYYEARVDSLKQELMNRFLASANGSGPSSHTFRHEGILYVIGRCPDCGNTFCLDENELEVERDDVFDWASGELSCPNCGSVLDEEFGRKLGEWHEGSPWPF